MAATHFSGPLAVGADSVEELTAAKTLTNQDNGKTFYIATDAIGITVPSTMPDGFTVTVVNTGTNAYTPTITGSGIGIQGTIGAVSMDDAAITNTKLTSVTGDYATVRKMNNKLYIVGGVGVWTD